MGEDLDIDLMEEVFLEVLIDLVGGEIENAPRSMERVKLLGID